MLLAAVASLSVYATHVHSQQLDPIRNYCTLFDHQSVLKNNTIYIDGGKQSFIDVDADGKQVGEATMGTNQYLITVDLTKPWDWKTNISMKALPKPGYPRRPTAPPVTSGGDLLYGSDDDPNIYLFGGTVSQANISFPGFTGPQPMPFSMWSFDINSQEWNHYDFTDNIQYRPSFGARAGARDQHRSFWFNGQVDAGSSTHTANLGSSTSIYLEGMIMVDHSNQTAKNISTKAVVGNKPRSRGEMQYMGGIGGNGIIVLIGGNEKIVSDTTDRGLGDLVPMDRIHVFDVSSIYDEHLSSGGTWYEQPATGDIPERRADFCLMKATAADSSSANIYMFGGRGANDTAFDDVYVLSIPSFTWIKVYEGPMGRYGHTCHRASNREVVAVGGISATNLSTGHCDWRTKGVHVFDISNLTWSSKYTVSKGNYLVPDAVTARIGGNGRGNATVKAPAQGFADIGLARIFGSDFIAPSPASPPSAREMVPNSRRRAIIAGAVVGGSVLLALTSAAIWFFRRTLQRILIGDLAERVEMDGRGKNVAELAPKGLFWELPGSEPAELWSPTVTASPTEPDDFKHETRSDRELGWRGEVGCIGDVAKSKSVVEEKSQVDAMSNHTQSSCEEFD